VQHSQAKLESGAWAVGRWGMLGHDGIKIIFGSAWMYRWMEPLWQIEGWMLGD